MMITKFINDYIMVINMRGKNYAFGSIIDAFPIFVSVIFFLITIAIKRDEENKANITCKFK